MFKTLVNNWLKSKHYYNKIIKFDVTSNLIDQFAIKNNKYKYLGNKELINYFLGNMDFKDLIEEKAFGTKIYQDICKVKSPPSNWSTKISEEFCKELLSYVFDTNVTNCKNDRELHIRLDLQSNQPDFKNFFEVKCRTYLTTGTAGEKILGTPKKYSKVYLKYKIPLYIILVGYQEKEAVDKFDLFNLNPMNKLHKNDIKLMNLYYHDFHINYIRSSDLIKLALLKFENKTINFKLISDAIKTEIDLKNNVHSINMNKTKDKTDTFSLNPGPFLKWVGGKNQIINTVLNSFPKNINNYHEIFLGGGSVLLGLLQKIENKEITLTGKINACDLNNSLITTYIVLQKKSKKLVKALAKLTKEYHDISTMKGDRNATKLADTKKSKESYYYYIRNCYNKEIKKDKSSNIKIASYLIFLNKTGFRGLYRTGPNGFNVPFGHYKNPKIYNEEQMYSISRLIKDVEFKVADFEESIMSVKEKDFVYMDPPYVPENSKSFTKYTSKDFSLESHNKLFKMTKNLATNNISFVMSNAKVDLVTTTFKKFTIKELEVKRAINSKNPGAKTKEVLIIGKAIDINKQFNSLTV